MCTLCNRGGGGIVARTSLLIHVTEHVLDLVQGPVHDRVEVRRRRYLLCLDLAGQDLDVLAELEQLTSNVHCKLQ